MARVGNRGETHVWFDGEFWFIYTERLAEIRRFEGWFGAPTRRGRDNAVAYWDSLPKDSLRIRRRRKAVVTTGAKPVPPRRKPATT